VFHPGDVEPLLTTLGFALAFAIQPLD